MSDLNLIASRLPGATGAISALAITATVPDPPKSFIALDNGTILRGTVQGRDKDGLITIKTDHGYLKIATNANLQPGANVTLEVRSVGDRLQVVVLAADQGAGHPIDLHGSAVQQNSAESSGDTRLGGRIGGGSSNQAIDPATRPGNTAAADSKQATPTVIVAGTRLTAIVIQALPRELLQNPAAGLQQATEASPTNLQPPAVDGVPVTGRALFTAEFLATPPPPISASLLPDIHDRIAALFAEQPGQPETTSADSSAATSGLTLPPETRERIVALFVGQQSIGQQGADFPPGQTASVGNSSENAQLPARPVPPASQTPQPQPFAAPPKPNAQPLSGNGPIATVPDRPPIVVPAGSSASPQQPITTPSSAAPPPVSTGLQPGTQQAPTSNPELNTPVAKDAGPIPVSSSAVPAGFSSPSPPPTALPPNTTLPPVGAGQQADGQQGPTTNTEPNAVTGNAAGPTQPQSSVSQASASTQIAPSAATTATNAAAYAEADLTAPATGTQRPAAATLQSSGYATVTQSTPAIAPLATSGATRADVPPQQSLPDQPQPRPSPNLQPNASGSASPQQLPPVAPNPTSPAAKMSNFDPAGRPTPPIGVPPQAPSSTAPAPAPSTIGSGRPQSPSLPPQSPASGIFAAQVPNTGVPNTGVPNAGGPISGQQAPAAPLQAPRSGGGVPAPVNPTNNLPPQSAGAAPIVPAATSAPSPVLTKSPTPAALQSVPFDASPVAASSNPTFQAAPASQAPVESQAPAAPGSQTPSSGLPPAPLNVLTTSPDPSAPISAAVPQQATLPTAGASATASAVPNYSTAAIVASNASATSDQKGLGSDVNAPQNQLVLNALQNSQPSAVPRSPSPLTPAVPSGSSQLPPAQISPELLAQLVADAPDLVTLISQPPTVQTGGGLSGAINPTLLQIIANVAAQPSAVAWIAGHAAGQSGTASPTSPEQPLSQPGQGHVPSVSPANLPANLIAIANAIPQDIAVPPSPIAPAPTNPGTISPGIPTSTDTAGQSATKTATTPAANLPKMGTNGATIVSEPVVAKDSGIPLTAVVSSLNKVQLSGAGLATANAEYLATNLAVSGASDSTVSKFDLTGKEQLVGPLPTGTEVRLRVLNIQTQSGPLVSIGATPGNKAAITGQILGHTPAGHPVIHTALGDLVLQQQATLPVGGEITLALEAVEMASSASTMASSLTPQMTAMTLAQGWPTLLDLLMTLQHGLASSVPTPGTPGDTGDAGSMAHLPQPGNKLAAGMAAAVDAFRSGDFEKLFGPLASSLKSTGSKQDAVRKLRDEFGQLSLLAQDRGNQDWKCFMLPIWDDGRLQQINLFYRRPRRQQSDGKDKNDDATRFIVDVNFTKLGGCQLDGLIHKKTFDLMVRSHRELPLPVKRDIAGLFAQARDICNYAGEVSFQTAMRFPVSPLDDIAKGPPSVTA